ncbi:MAG TPA: hypothetical protein VG253_12050 [Streptosporangiaceae bacterium]|nr:hypothetical protein [Streptosporangiaceae bacterium]
MSWAAGRGGGRDRGGHSRGFWRARYDLSLGRLLAADLAARSQVTWWRIAGRYVASGREACAE